MRWLLTCVVTLLCAVVWADEIHPAMRKAMDAQDSAPYIVLDGKRHYTGFSPGAEFYDGASFLRFQPTVSELPKSWDMRDHSYSPVRGQLQGSCWAEGNVSAFELTWNYILGTEMVFSVDDVIHCSGYGTARWGGQMSLRYNTKRGLAFEKDYPYTAKDGPCRENVPRQFPLRAAPFLRGPNGGFPTERELMEAGLKYGAFEVCGSASSLGRGGRQDHPRGGRTDHCYAWAGWLDGEEMGWLPGKYHLIKNSWGDCDRSNQLSNGRCWGDKGWGYYRLNTGNGRLSGSVITEIQVADTGRALIIPGYFEFELESDSARLVVEVHSSLGVSELEAINTLRIAIGP